MIYGRRLAFVVLLTMRNSAAVDDAGCGARSHPRSADSTRCMPREQDFDKIDLLQKGHQVVSMHSVESGASGAEYNMCPEKSEIESDVTDAITRYKETLSCESNDDK